MKSKIGKDRGSQFMHSSESQLRPSIVDFGLNFLLTFVSKCRGDVLQESLQLCG